MTVRTADAAAVGRGQEALRRLGAEPVLFLGAQRALLLQVAHPLVGTAVDEHSGFRAQPVRRLWATADAMLCLVWGRPSQAAAARARIEQVHHRVHGTLPAEAGPWPAGTGYTAHELSLQAWVWATLVDTTVVVQGRWLRPLDGPELDDLYAGWLGFASAFGIGPHGLPPTWEAFGPWYAEGRAGLAVGPATREVGRAILDPPLPWAPRALRRTHARVAAGLLDPWLRAEYGVRWGVDDDAAMDLYDEVLRAFWAVVPAWRRALPPAYVAVRRVLGPVVDQALATGGGVRRRGRG